MLKGKLIALLTIFSSVSLIGTGFSSWVIGTSKAIVNGNIEVADLIDTKFYFEVNPYKGNNHSGISNILYNSYGFVNDGQCVYNTTMTYFLLFKGKQFSDNYGTKYKNISFSFRLSHDSNLSLLQSSYVSASYRYIVGGNEAKNATTGFTNGNLNTSINNFQVYSVSDKLLLNSFTTEKPFMVFELTYSFNVSNSTNYNAIYQELQNSTSSQFKLTLNISGDNQ